MKMNLVNLFLILLLLIGLSFLLSNDFLTTEAFASATDTVNSSCLEYYNSGQTSDGVYTIQPKPNGPEVDVWCDMDNGGWTIIDPNRDSDWRYYFKSWQSYANGLVFGPTSDDYPSPSYWSWEDWFNLTEKGEIDVVFSSKGYDNLDELKEKALDEDQNKRIKLLVRQNSSQYKREPGLLFLEEIYNNIDKITVFEDSVRSWLENVISNNDWNIRIEKGFKETAFARSPDCKTVGEQGKIYRMTGNFYDCYWFNDNCDFDGSCHVCQDDWGQRDKHGTCPWINGSHHAGNEPDSSYPQSCSGDWWNSAPSIGANGDHCVAYKSEGASSLQTSNYTECPNSEYDIEDCDAFYGRGVIH